MALEIALSGDNLLYLGGGFVSAGGNPANNVARWDGTNWLALGSGVTAVSAALVSAVYSTGSELFVGGIFDRAGGRPSTNIALWHIPHSLAISRSGDSVELSWPATGSNLLLQATSSLSETNWVPILQPPAILNGQCVVTNDISATRQFYRLRRR